MKKLLTLIIVAVAFGVKAQSNNPAPYCLSNYSSGCVERWISDVSTVGASTNLANYTGGCGGHFDGYHYYCENYAAVTAGQTFTVNFTIGGVAVYNTQSSVYIDWNNDNVFTVPSERFYFGTWTTNTASYSFSVTVPPATPIGKYRMRVRCEQFGIINNPCTTIGRGETEDYDIYVGIIGQQFSPITATVTTFTTNVCSGQPIFLNVNHSATTTPTFSWIGPLSFTSAAQNPTILNASTANNGWYQVTVSTGTCPAVSKALVTVVNTPTVTVNPVGVCQGYSTTLTAGGANSYTWSTSVQGPTAAVSPTATTVYSVSGSNFNCISSQTVLVTVLPQFTLSLGSPTICAGSQATMSVIGGATYTWSTGSNFGTAYDSPTTTTVYTITVASGTCTNTGSITQIVIPCTDIASTNVTEKNISIFPNPFKDELKVVSPPAFQLKIVDLTGKEVLTKEITGESIIHTSHLAKGVYFIHFVGKEGVKPLKLIKD